MVKVLRKYNKYILVVGGSLLMVAFLMPTAINELRTDPMKQVVAHIGDDGVRQRELFDAETNFRAVKTVMPAFLFGAIGTPIVDGAHWYLLAREARAGGFVGGEQDGRDWERPMSLELIHPDGRDGFQIDGGIRIRGGFSRSTGNPKHAFRFFFRPEYGASRLRHPLFGAGAAEEFEGFDLRTFQNYSWSFQGDRTGTFLRDQFNRDVQLAMGSQAYRQKKSVIPSREVRVPKARRQPSRSPRSNASGSKKSGLVASRVWATAGFASFRAICCSHKAR